MRLWQVQIFQKLLLRLKIPKQKNHFPSCGGVSSRLSIRVDSCISSSIVHDLEIKETDATILVGWSDDLNVLSSSFRIRWRPNSGLPERGVEEGGRTSNYLLPTLKLASIRNSQGATFSRITLFQNKCAPFSVWVFGYRLAVYPGQDWRRSRLEGHNPNESEWVAFISRTRIFIN